LKGITKRLKIRWGWLLCTGILLLMMLWSCTIFNRDFYVRATGNWHRKRIAIYVLPMLLCMVLSQFRPKIAPKWHAAVRALFVAAVIVFTQAAFQSLCWDTLWYGLGIPMRVDCLLVNLSITAIVFTAVWLLIWDSRRAVMITYWLMAALGYVYRCIFDFRGAIFKISDLMVVGTAAEVASRYGWSLQSEQVFWIACGMLMWVVSLWVPRQKCRAKKAKLGKAFCVLAACGWIGVLLYSPLLDAMQISTNTWLQTAIWDNGRQGVLTTLMKEIQNMSGIQPKHYQPEQLAQMDERLLQGGLNETEGEKPNVIVVMNEALADLQTLWQIDADQEALPFIHSLRDQTVWGNVYVSSFAGGTCNTEHSFLTGTIPVPDLPMALLSTVKERTPSLAWQMKSLGYRTVAIHPENPKNYQRDEYYPRLGLDTFFSESAFEDAPRLREFVSDSACYEKIISLYNEKARDEKLFVFNVTMQNHSPYETSGLEEKVHLSNSDKAPMMQEYLNSVRRSDEAFEELVSCFAAQDEPTVILLFGDHQPLVETEAFPKQPDLSETAERFTQYITPFVIWANYPIEAKYVEGISVNYLSALLMDTAGLPMTGYDEWLLKTAQKYPVVNLYGYGDAEGQSAFWDSDEENWPEELQQLNLLRYNRLYDVQNRLPALQIPD